MIATVFTNGATKASTHLLSFSEENKNLSNTLTLGKEHQLIFNEVLIANGQRMMYSLGSYLSSKKYENLFKKVDVDNLKIFSSEFTHSLRGARAFEIGVSGFDTQRYKITKKEENEEEKNEKIEDKKYLFPPFEFDMQLELSEEQPEYDHALPYGLLPSNIQNFNITSDKMFFSDFDKSCPQLAPSFKKGQQEYLQEAKVELDEPIKKFQSELADSDVKLLISEDFPKEPTFEDWSSIFKEARSYFFKWGALPQNTITWKQYNQLFMLHNIYLYSFYQKMNLSNLDIFTTQIAKTIIEDFDMAIDRYKKNIEHKNQNDNRILKEEIEGTKMLAFSGIESTILVLDLIFEHTKRYCPMQIIKDGWDEQRIPNCNTKILLGTSYIFELSERKIMEKNVDENSGTSSEKHASGTSTHNEHVIGEDTDQKTGTSSSPSGSKDDDDSGYDEKNAKYEMMVKVIRNDHTITSYCSPEYLDAEGYCIFSKFKEFVTKKMVNANFQNICEIKISKARLYTFWVVLAVLISMSVALTITVIRIYSKLEMFRDDEENSLTIGSMLSGLRKSSISMFESDTESVR